MAKGEDLELDVSGGDNGESAAPKSKKKLFIIIGVVVFVIIAAVAAMFFMGMFGGGDEVVAEDVVETADGEKKAPKEEDEILAEEPIYWPIEPPFVMNFEGPSTAKYMQIEFTAMTKSQKSIDALKLHIPAVRNELTFLLGAQKFSELNTVEGKSQLRDEIIETINMILTENGAKKGIETIYFTSFVMQ